MAIGARFGPDTEPYFNNIQLYLRCSDMHEREIDAREHSILRANKSALLPGARDEALKRQNSLRIRLNAALK